jgi:hypothetical protein
MSIFKKYKDYLQDNLEGYWFKRKLYGYGWAPAKWQGWLVTLLVTAFVVWQAITLDSGGVEPTAAELESFFIRIGVAIIILIVIAAVKGEKPRWQWGIPEQKED